MADYYARNDYERKMDTQIREAVRAKNDKALMAMYVQGQATLNLLRRIDDKLKGYPVDDGYMGWIEEFKCYRKFPTEGEYREFIAEVE